MAHITFHAQLADGSTTTRSSKTRSYTHVLQVTDRDTGRVHAYSWHTTPELADKAASAARGWGFYSSVVTVDVTASDYSSPEAKSARALEKSGR